MTDQVLPEDSDAPLQEEVESPEAKAARLASVEAFAEIVKGKRKDAINGRAASGIEREWQEDEDYYEGYDEASSKQPTMMKGRSLTDGAVIQPAAESSGRSTVFLKITRP